MITTVQPDTIGTLVTNDKFNFENDTDTYYFIGNFGINGFVFWNDAKKIRKVMYIMGYDTYSKIKIVKIKNLEI
jgi:hypothetical protein